MKTSIFVFIVVLSINLACKTQDEIKNDKSVDIVVNAGTTLGQVSHQYRETGCATVVIIHKEGQKDITLIPIETLPEKYDKDKLEIYFNYHTLKVKNPDGCNVGIPAILTDISKK